MGAMTERESVSAPEGEGRSPYPGGRLPVLLLGTIGAIAVLAYLFVACQRIAYPYELEWMEGGCVVEVQRILDGQPLYVEPSLGFVPFMYTPFYFVASSWSARIFGNGFLALRLVSFAASLGSMVLIFLMVSRRTGSRLAAFLGAALFAATFRVGGAWFDLARVDSLWVFLLLASFWAFEDRRLLVRTVVAAALISLAFFTKQPAAMVAGGLAVAGLASGKRYERLLFPALVTAMILGPFALVERRTGAWFSYYVLGLPFQHTAAGAHLMGFWTNDLLRHLPIALGLAVFAVFHGGGEERGWRRRFSDSAILGAFLLAAYLPRLHQGGFDNVLIPAFAAIAIYFGVGFHLAATRFARKKALGLGLAGLTALQFGLLSYRPWAQLPSAAHRRAGRHLLETIARFPGPVYCPDHPWYLRMCGKPTQGHDMAIMDILRARYSAEWKARLATEMKRAVEEERYDAFIVDDREFALRSPVFDHHYRLLEGNLTGPSFYPLTGWRRKPGWLYVRRGPGPRPRPGPVPRR